MVEKQSQLGALRLYIRAQFKTDLFKKQCRLTVKTKHVISIQLRMLIHDTPH